MKILNLEDLEILGAVLPSVKEIENLTQKQREFKYWYWLRSPCKYISQYAAAVSNDGSVYDDEVDSGANAVRPALVIENLPDFYLQTGEEVEIKGLSEEFSKYIVINEHMLLADFYRGRYAFNEDPNKGNDYWTSDVRQVVDKWFEIHFQERE